MFMFLRVPVSGSQCFMFQCIIEHVLVVGQDVAVQILISISMLWISKTGV